VEINLQIVHQVHYLEEISLLEAYLEETNLLEAYSEEKN
jgi:hypothetical protein